MSHESTKTQWIQHGSGLPPAGSPASGASALPEVTAPATINLDPGTVFDLRAGIVHQRVEDRTLRMYAFNGSIPGPTLRVTQGSEVIIHFKNDLDTPALLHWQGLRLSNLFDPLARDDLHSAHLQVPAGGSFSYRLHFPDVGLYCYHHDVREDCSPEHSLYGGIVVVPSDPDYWPPVHRELVLTWDELLTPCTHPKTHAPAMPGDIPSGCDCLMLINGETVYPLQAYRGEVVRFYLVNVANSRAFRLRIPGARIKHIGADLGEIERHTLVDELALYPMQRGIVDVLFEHAGYCRLEQHAPDGVHLLGHINVADQPAYPSLDQLFYRPHRSEAWRLEREKLFEDWERPPDRMLLLTNEMCGLESPTTDALVAAEYTAERPPLAHETPKGESQAWEMVDVGTGAVNQWIDRAFPLGQRAKIRLVHAAATSGLMPHSLHLHGQRFLVLERNGVRAGNLMWQDTLWIQVGETIDILLDAAHPQV